MLSKRCVSTAHHGVLIYTPPKHTLSCVILRTKGVFGEHTMVCSGNTLVFTYRMLFLLNHVTGLKKNGWPSVNNVTSGQSKEMTGQTSAVTVISC